MTHIKLRVYLSPSQIDVFINIKNKKEGHDRLTATIDTGAPITLLPKKYMEELEYRLSENETVTLQQAGIAKQVFQATEAYVTMYLEDWTGSRTEEFEARVWFADTNQILIGFDGILDRSVLYVDMPNQTGYLDFA